MASELKSCPFCGGANITTYRPMQPAGSSRRVVLCGGCGATAATEVWNRRAAAQVNAALLTACEAAYAVLMGPDCAGNQTVYRVIDCVKGAIASARAAAESEMSQPAPLAWTREKPWQSGWYWIRVSNGWPTIIRIDQSDVDHPRLAFGRNIEFAGPIPKPEESKS